MTGDALLDLLVLYFVAASAWTVYVAYRFVEAARIRPHMEALTGSAYVKVGIMVGTLLGAILGINSVSVVAGGPRFIPQPVALVLLAAAISAPSLAEIPMLRLLRRWSGTTKAGAHVHARDREPGVRHHRRAGDLPEAPAPEPPAEMP